MVNDSDIRNAQYKVDDLRAKLRAAKDEALRLESEIRRQEQTVDELTRQKRREDERAAAEKRQAEDNARRKSER